MTEYGSNYPSFDKLKGTVVDSAGNTAIVKQFEKSILELQKQDNYYEKKDDEVREKIILQLSGASERLGESSSEIERRLMEREVE